MGARMVLSIVQLPAAPRASNRSARASCSATSNSRHANRTPFFDGFPLKINATTIQLTPPASAARRKSAYESAVALYNFILSHHNEHARRVFWTQRVCYVLLR